MAWLLSTILLLGYFVTGTVAQQVRVPLAIDWCTSRADDFYQDPFNCYKFVRCVGGLKYEFDCPSGTRWDANVYTCNFQELTSCNTTNYIEPPTTVATPICPSEVFTGNQRDSTNCGRYYRCNSGVPSLESCSQELYFSPTFATCVPYNSLRQDEMAFCSSLSNPTTTSPLTAAPPFCPVQVVDANQRDNTNCGRYYRCRSGTASLEVCAQELYFSPTWGSCVPYGSMSQAEKDFCGSPTTATPTTVAPPFCPVQVVDANQRDSTNCGRYYRCRSGTASLEVCAQELYFSPTWGSCVPYGSLSQAEKDFCGSPTTAAPTVAPPLCPVEIVDANQRDNTNCGRYYRCRSGIASLEVCAQELYFSPTWGSCVPYGSLSQAEKDFCGSPTTTAPTTAPAPFCPVNIVDGNQRDSTNCGRYYRCRSGVRTLEVCQQDLYFSPAWAICLPFNSLTQDEQNFCSGQTTATTPTPTTEQAVICPVEVTNGVQRDPTNCGRFYRCTSGSRSLESCLQDLFFNTQWGTCTAFNSLSVADKEFCSAITTTLAPITVAAPYCPPEIADGRQRDETNCGRYYRCRNGASTLEFCGQGLYFNPTWGACTPYNRLTQTEKDFCNSLSTTTTMPTPVCPANVNEALQRDPNNCNRYIRCVNGAAYSMTCGAGEYFNTVSSTQPCGKFEDMTPTDQGVCAALEAQRATDPDVYCVPNVPVGFIRDAKNCSQYYWCVNGVPYLRLCDQGLYYSTYLQACSVFDDLSPTDKGYCTALEPTTVAPPIVCPTALFAQVTHPTDCTKYYQCQAGVPSEISCVVGTYYNTQTFRCDPPQQLSKERYDLCVGVTTTAISAKVVCRGNNEGLYMDFYDSNCRRYYNCRLGQITTVNDSFVCPAGSYFNVITRSCGSFETLPPTFQETCVRV